MKTLSLMKDMQKMIVERYCIEDKSVIYEWFVQLQETAIEIGQFLEKQEQSNDFLIHELEEYCELIYRLSDEEVNFEKLQTACHEKLFEIYCHVDAIDVEAKIAFLPYKYSMWDCMESIWQAASADRKCCCQVIPIPYYDRKNDGSLGEMHYEGSVFPKEINVIDYHKYDLTKEKPDIVYIHNPYDEYNKVTCIDPAFFMERIKEQGSVLVYVPYYISGYCLKLENMMSLCRTKGAVCSDYIVLQSEKLKKAYECCGIESEKLLVTGSPKIDKMFRLRASKRRGKEEWMHVLGDRKVVLLNSGLSTFLCDTDWLDYVDGIIDQVLSDPEMVLVWRPHPLLSQTIYALRYDDIEKYEMICNKVQAAENGILDLSEDYMDAVAASDAMISDYSSLVLQYTFCGKPALLLCGSKKYREQEVFCDYFSNYFLSDGVEISEFLQMIKNENDAKKNERIQFAENSVVNADGTCGVKTHKAIMENIQNMKK